eukprot:3459205-Amphidinium_carterae.1
MSGFQEDEVDFEPDAEPMSKPMSDQEVEGDPTAQSEEEDVNMTSPVVATHPTNRPPSPPLSPSQLVPTPPPYPRIPTLTTSHLPASLGILHSSLTLHLTLHAHSPITPFHRLPTTHRVSSLLHRVSQRDPHQRCHPQSPLDLTLHQHHPLTAQLHLPCVLLLGGTATHNQ